MRLQPSLLWTWNAVIGRVPYLLTGAALFLVKFVIDSAIATNLFGRIWSPVNYLVWPNDRVLRVFELDDPERWFSLTMLLVSLPFIWTGVILSLHRLRAVGLPLGLIVLFFVPLVNLLLFLILALLPSRKIVPAIVMAYATPKANDWNPLLGAARSKDARIIPAESLPRDAFHRDTKITKNVPRPGRRRFEPLREYHRSIVLESYWRSGMMALVVTVPLVVLAVVLSAEVLQSYGFGLFLCAPFAVGMFSVLLFGFSRPQPLGACLLVALAGTVLVGSTLLGIALEGFICLIMALPITLPLALLGAVVGYAIQSRPWLDDQRVALMLALVIALPALMAAESSQQLEPDVRAVRTEVLIDAPPAQVWEHVIAFPPLPEPDDWLFQTGIAYPLRAEIQGAGVGAIRYCVFTTGTFVEPIEVWEAPTLLRFRVTEQPEPMREWSPYHIHPAHLDHYLHSQKGQFVLEALPGERTRLVGTTWYSNRMWPAAYWNLWSDFIIHRIHGRVLTHIQKLAEAHHQD
jgi:hypothetical protein